MNKEIKIRTKRYVGSSTKRFAVVVNEVEVAEYNNKQMALDKARSI